MPDSDNEIKLAYSVQRLAYRKDEAKKVGAYCIRPKLYLLHITNYCIQLSAYLRVYSTTVKSIVTSVIFPEKTSFKTNKNL
jgi:hypothetical protein